MTARKYYESAIGNMISDYADSTISQIDAALYNNHGVIGQVGDCSINGAMVCRDEAIIYSGKVRFNWDIRLGSSSYEGEYPDIPALRRHQLNPSSPMEPGRDNLKSKNQTTTRRLMEEREQSGVSRIDSVWTATRGLSLSHVICACSRTQATHEQKDSPESRAQRKEQILATQA